MIWRVRQRTVQDEQVAAPLVLDEDDALELLAFLISAARTQVDEAREYGPLRLLTAAHRVVELGGDRWSASTIAFVEQTLSHVPLLAVPRDDAADYVRRLDELCAALGEHLRNRYLEESG